MDVPTTEEQGGNRVRNHTHGVTIRGGLGGEVVRQIQGHQECVS